MTTVTHIITINVLPAIAIPITNTTMITSVIYLAVANTITMAITMTATTTNTMAIVCTSTIETVMSEPCCYDCDCKCNIPWVFL